MCEYPDIIEVTSVRARKSHYCYECSARILKGEEYERVKGLWDGHWDTFSTCNICIELRNWVHTNLVGNFDCMAYGELSDWVFDNHESIPRSLLPSHWLLQLDNRAIEGICEDPKWEYSQKCFVGYDWTMKTLSKPKQYKSWKRSNIKSLADATLMLNYLIKTGGSNAEYTKKKLEGCFV
jgi:hypothetical protein